MTPKTENIGMRIPLELLERIDRLRAGPHGTQVARSEIIRLALERGLAALEKKRPTKG